MEDFKPRDRQLGPATDHIGQPRRDKSELEKAATTIDQGPNFGTPGDPPDADPDALDEIEEAQDGQKRQRSGRPGN